MLRRNGHNRLRADIEAASHETIPHIQKIGKGDIEDEFIFTFSHPQVPHGEIEIRAMPQDTGGYPGDNSFLVYTNGSVSPKVGGILDSAMTSTTGMRIPEFLRTISRQLRTCLESANATEGAEAIAPDTDMDADSLEAPRAPDDSDTDISFDYDDDDDDDFGLYGTPQDSITHKKTPGHILEKIRRDFRTVRNAGFRVGKICGVDYVSEHNIMTISVKASKLGLSEETHMAWNLQPSDYIVLLMMYSGKYTSFDDAMGTPTGQIPLCLKLRKCSKYRPASSEAIDTFVKSLPNNVSRKTERKISNREGSPDDGGNLSRFGVGDSINQLLGNGFLDMMKLRKRENVTWDDAKKIHSEAAMSTWGDGPKELLTSGPTPNLANIVDKNLPSILMNDHLLSEGPVSLPLVAMQFALRYLVKCTEYCMICHERMFGKFEALKPYVCAKPLCLFQYMSLGLGPSIDNEIINHQHVVDLLISFCYASLQCSKDQKPRLREFPLGLSLQVPCIRKPVAAYNSSLRQNVMSKNNNTLIDPLEIEVSWRDSKATITEKSGVIRPHLKVGQWVVIHTGYNDGKPTSEQSPTDILHYARIEGMAISELQLHFASRHPVPMGLAEYEAVRQRDWGNEAPTAALLVLCNRSLDEIKDDEEKAFSLTLLLSALPSVGEMRSYLIGKQSRQLVSWDRIPPSAMKLLRWIIASNRSFIVQVDSSLSSHENSGITNYEGPDRSQEKILGMDGWIQFRFAQGSPEKEALFLDALQQVKSPHRTILAWHGSAIGNWHSIIRDGLNFNVITNGRSFGNGVYFSRSFEYSLHYSRSAPGDVGSPLPEHIIWPQSSLKITNAISLNELVNLPHKFHHSVSCYVVDILHWIQCRYLFVRPWQDDIGPVQERKKGQIRAEEFEQDPKYAITGPQNKKIFVPKIAIPSVQQRPNHVLYAISDDTDDENINDIDFLGPAEDTAQTDFRPGSLDFSQLPQFALPSYATKPAQQVIQRELQKLQKIQSTTPLHELGWYLDFDRIDNMFQWIVELHSFERSLPLAKDMKAAGITSIVLEIRFLRGFPLTPPFIRVIKPKFLPYARGGGGHVTAGGALCMELLTNTGWSPVGSMESVLLQVRLAMCSLDPKPARLERLTPGNSQYSMQEAVEAYMRAATSHGWEVPAELKEAAMI
ncbi:hypothetical protein GGR51DRAFT_552941 [Nemania sp. FL0031]|nr:hypothetical protein GGR51DRAFT_552941 [Nemania sp. FL0031]